MQCEGVHGGGWCEGVRGDGVRGGRLWSDGGRGTLCTCEAVRLTG